jgi:phage terminase small subunit
VSDRLKTLRNTARGDRPARRRIQPEPGARPPSPDWPDPVQRRYAELVEAMGEAVTQADAGVLELTARAQVEVQGCDSLIQTEGLIYTSGSRGMRRPNPVVADAQRRALVGLRALGLTPIDRHKVEVAEPPAFDLKRYTR